MTCMHASVDTHSSNFWLAFLYLALALLCGFQCGRIIYYKHNLFSYQFGFLCLCLIFAGLRFLLFLFMCGLKYSIGYDIMYWIPFNIQFLTFSLLVTFYAHILNQNPVSNSGSSTNTSNISTPQQQAQKQKKIFMLYGVSNLVFVLFVIVILVLSGVFHDYDCEKRGCCACAETCCPTSCFKGEEDGCGTWYDTPGEDDQWCVYEPKGGSSWQLDFDDPNSDGECVGSTCPCVGKNGKGSHGSFGCCQPLWLINFGAGVAGTLFLVLDLFIGVYGWRIGQRMMDSTGFKVPFQPKGGDPRKILVITALIFLIFLSRSLFDFGILTGVNLIDPSTGRFFDEFINFCLYILWEITPTTSIVILFWNIPRTEVGLLGGVMGGKQGGGRERNVQEESVHTPLFKDRRRYDSDDDESTNFTKGGASTLYGTPHYPYMTNPSINVSIAGHSPYPTTTNSQLTSAPIDDDDDDKDSFSSTPTSYEGTGESTPLSYDSHSFGSPEGEW